MLEGMNALLLLLTTVVVMLVLLGSSLWVALALVGTGFVMLTVFTPVDSGLAISFAFWGSTNSWELAALPMFIWMGEILFRTRLSSDMFAGLSPWVSRLPGGLMHTNVLGSGVFAAISGSSAATAATIGKMTVPELRKRGYDEKMMVGTLAGSGTLGLLVPPSIILIVYGAGSEQSIARLFIAGIIPALVLIGLFIGYVMVWSMLNRDKVPQETERAGWREKWQGLKKLAPAVALIAGIIGSIYSGLASPTEAAAVGVALALLLARMTGSLTRDSFTASLMGAMRTSCMIIFILAGAAFLTVAMGFTGIPELLANWVGEQQFSPLWLLVALTVLFILLGCFLDGISVVVLTTSIVLPLVDAAGFDLIWFGIYLVLVVEMSQITPPVGFNLFVLQSLTGKNILYIAKAALPFFVILLLMVALISAMPEMVTWLPENM